MRKTILVTGASGFLGRELIRTFRKDEGIQLIASTDSPDKLQEQQNNPRVRIVPRRFFESDDFSHTRIDVAVNCAYPRNANGFLVADGLRYLEDCIRALHADHVGAIINISSQSVYDQERVEAATEESPMRLDDVYSVGKYAVERMMEWNCANQYHTNLRIASLIGAGFNQRIINRFVQDALAMKRITVSKSMQTFAFMDVRDIANAIYLLTEVRPDAWKHVYNIGMDPGYTLVEIMQVIQSVFRAEGLPFPEVIYTDSEKVGNSALDDRVFRKDTGFKPQYSLEDSVVSILKWFQA